MWTKNMHKQKKKKGLSNKKLNFYSRSNEIVEKVKTFIFLGNSISYEGEK